MTLKTPVACFSKRFFVQKSRAADLYLVSLLQITTLLEVKLKRMNSLLDTNSSATSQDLINRCGALQ